MALPQFDIATGAWVADCPKCGKAKAIIVQCERIDVNTGFCSAKVCKNCGHRITPDRCPAQLPSCKHD